MPSFDLHADVDRSGCVDRNPAGPAARARAPGAAAVANLDDDSRPLPRTRTQQPPTTTINEDSSLKASRPPYLPIADEIAERRNRPGREIPQGYPWGFPCLVWIPTTLVRLQVGERLPRSGSRPLTGTGSRFLSRLSQGADEQARGEG